MRSVVQVKRDAAVRKALACIHEFEVDDEVQDRAP